jgi:hypothetical protein
VMKRKRQMDPRLRIGVNLGGIAAGGAYAPLLLIRVCWGQEDHYELCLLAADTRPCQYAMHARMSRSSSLP